MQVSSFLSGDFLCMLMFEYYSMHINKSFFLFTSNRNDGDEPDYMAVNPTEWLSSTMQACCKSISAGIV